MNELLRRIPSVHKLLEAEKGQKLCDEYGRERVRDIMNRYLEHLRNEIQSKKEEGETSGDGTIEPADLDVDSLLDQTEKRLQQRLEPRVTSIVNATGVVLHTGLGRAVLSEKVLDHLQEVNRGYSLLAVDREHNERIRRETGAVRMIEELTGAESATVVNNNAAAVLLLLSTFARDREVIISRGELVEIGGSFRVPDVMEQSGAHLVEVGTTNKTHLSDYRKAIGENTAMLMRVHTSNYRIEGFQKQVDMEELSNLARQEDVLAVEDLGSGALFDLSEYGLPEEPYAREVLESGADLVCFSCDKLLGGPQAGVIAGRTELVDQVRQHPLFRALRLDKLIISALERTLQHYLSPGNPVDSVPALEMLTREENELRQKAEHLAETIEQKTSYKTGTRKGTSQPGGGSLPGHHMDTVLVEVQSPDKSARQLQLELRLTSPSVFSRVRDEVILLDPRTLLEGDEERILEALQSRA